MDDLWGQVEWDALDMMCGCGASWSGADAFELYEAHDCPLRGVQLDPEDLFALINDPGGRRRAHAAGIAVAAEQLGWATQPVFPTSDDYPHWAYTIGLWPTHAGEILVRGFDRHCAGMVDLIAQAVVDGVVPLTVGRHQFRGDLGEHEGWIRFDEWTGDPTDFGQAEAHHGTDDFPRFHCVWADDAGRFPEDEGCECAHFQMLGLPLGGTG